MSLAFAISEISGTPDKRVAMSSCEGGEVGLGVGLPPCRKTVVKDEEVKNVCHTRESCRARRDDGVHDLVLGWVEGG